MVVLSVALCTKTGKSLFARQFVDMKRGRVEGLLAAFPKLVGSAGSSQHTYVETDAVRYVYHPVDALYIVLITNKQSNIMEDLDTLHLLAKLVPDICGSTAYDVVQSKVFDVLFAFDEVITPGGYKEDITMRQVRVNMEMNSHDERLAQLIRQSKINEAKETAHAKAKALAEARRSQPKGFMEGFGSKFGGASSGSRYDRMLETAAVERAPARSSAPARTSSRAASSSRRAKRGMKLGSKKGKKADSMLQSLMKEEHIPTGAGSGAAAGAAVVEEAKAGPAVDVEVMMSEKLTVAMSRDGAVKKMQVNGTMALTCGSEAATRMRLNVALSHDSGFQFQPHPNVSKSLWKSGILALKDPSRTFPVGTAVSLLRWRHLSRDESSLPLSLNVWPDELSEGTMTVTVDYTLNRADLTLSNVVIQIPLPAGATPTVNQCDGAHSVSRDGHLEWTHLLIDSTAAEGTLEFEVSCDDESDFFPVNVSFTAKQCLCPIAVESVEKIDTEQNATGVCTFRAIPTLNVSSFSMADDG